VNAVVAIRVTIAAFTSDEVAAKFAIPIRTTMLFATSVELAASDVLLILLTSAITLKLETVASETVLDRVIVPLAANVEFVISVASLIRVKITLAARVDTEASVVEVNVSMFEYDVNVDDALRSMSTLVAISTEVVTALTAVILINPPTLNLIGMFSDAVLASVVVLN